MRDDHFEWDDRKAAENRARHGITFAMASDVFDDQFAIIELDDRRDYAEDRYSAIGMVDGYMLFVAYTLRGERIRIISARLAEPMSAANTMKRAAERAKTRRTKHDWSRVDAMTDAERHAAAMADPDAQPLTAEDFKRMKPVPRAWIIRRAFRLSQEEFAAQFHIPVGTLRDWEQGRKEPDAAAKAYLRVIASAPDVVRKALLPRPVPKR